MEAPDELRYLQLLFRTAYYCGLWPVYNVGGKDYRTSPWYKYYSIFLMFSFVLGNMTVVPRVVFTIEQDYPISLIVIENISMTALSGAIVTYIYKLSFRHALRFRKGLLELIHADKFPVGVTGKRVHAELIIGSTLFFLFAITDMTQYSDDTDALGYIGAFFWYLQEYYLFLMILVMRNYVLVLKQKLEGMNAYIEEYTVKITAGFRFEPNKVMRWNFGKLPRLYTALYEQVIFCNNLFGIPMLCLTVYCLGEVLYSFTNIFVSRVISTENNGFNNDVFFRFYVYVWVFHVLVYLFLIVLACEAATNEMNRTCVLCYRLLHELQNGNRVLNCNEALRDGVTLLAIQSAVCTPNFWAAGLFRFDNSSLFTLLNIVLSYLITIIQLTQ